MPRRKIQNEGKLYYSISEVARMTRLEAYVLRFWEKEFPMLHPKKNRGGNRIYQKHDIELINQIKQLLYKENYTIEGARNRLRSIKPTEEKKELVASGKAQTLLAEIKRDIEYLLKLFPCFFGLSG
ncbi:MAG: MerR family transcriptional regulator [candidate division Zixibacteria bacterium]|nr:MerR family transcriptional regulator [candidate division Zixibacteria bacterium]